MSSPIKIITSGPGGAQYVHWAAVAAIVVVLVYYVKQYYCKAEGLPGGSHPVHGAYKQTSAHPDVLRQTQAYFHGSVSKPYDNIDSLELDGCLAREAFLAGRESPVILAPMGLSPHRYSKAVKQAGGNAAEGFIGGDVTEDHPMCHLNEGELQAQQGH